MLWLTGVWAWLKKWGGLVLGGIGALLAFIFYEVWTRKPVVEPSVVSPENVEQHAHDEAAEQEQEDAKRAQQDTEIAEHEAQANWTANVAQVTQQTAIVQDSPDVVGRLLDAAGKQQRSP